jgi:pimeloyl-ACP methyl ester carboxylesterase
MRTWHRFRLEDCADDLAVLIQQLGSVPSIVVGYSMGGLITQLLWRRHPDLVTGLVLCSTTSRFVPGRRERYVFGTAMNYGAGTVRFSRLATKVFIPFGVLPRSPFRRRPSSMKAWAAAELRRHDLRQLLEAGHATCQFDSGPWINEVDVPTAVVVTTQDRVIPPDTQRHLAESIPGATVHEVDDDHTACAHGPFASALVSACRAVADRADSSVPKNPDVEIQNSGCQF